jgi:predicted lysophospholipase L1 biosynthesis ABC-type transport system permease subunit
VVLCQRHVPATQRAQPLLVIAILQGSLNEGQQLRQQLAAEASNIFLLNLRGNKTESTLALLAEQAFVLKPGC